MLGNIIDTNQYFESLVLNDKRREQLFADMMNTLYKAPGESILKPERSQKNLSSGQSFGRTVR